MHYTHENRSESDGGGLEAQVEVYGSSYHRVPSLFLQIQASFSLCESASPTWSCNQLRLMILPMMTTQALMYKDVLIEDC